VNNRPINELKGPFLAQNTIFKEGKVSGEGIATLFWAILSILPTDVVRKNFFWSLNESERVVRIGCLKRKNGSV